MYYRLNEIKIWKVYYVLFIFGYGLYCKLFNIDDLEFMIDFFLEII